MTYIHSHAEGVILDIRVVPRASKPGLAGTRDNALLVRLAAPPVEGAANDELIALLSDLLNVPRRAIAILSGDKNRQKRLLVRGISASDAARLLQS